MTHTVFRSLMLVAGMLGFAGPGYSQKLPEPAATSPAEASAAPTATPAAVTTPPATAAAPKTPTHVPSADLLKKAARAGYYKKVSRSDVLFCKKEVVLGSRFTDEHCMDENSLELTLLGQQAQRDQLQQLRGATTSVK
jgi:hypothetical protein